MKILPLLFVCLVGSCAPAAGSSNQAPNGATTPAPTAKTASTNGPRLAFPVACEIGKTCEVQNYVDRSPGAEATDYRCGGQSYQDHGGVDIRLLDMAAQAAGVSVLAAAPGRVVRLRDGVADLSVKTAGANLVAGYECGNGVIIDHGDGWETQYCHLAQGSVSVEQGDLVVSGQPIARIGLSGNTEYPHLHLAVRRSDVMVDPFAPDMAPGTCDVASAGDGLWTVQAAKAMPYKQGVVLNAGFAAAPLTMDAIDAGHIGEPTISSPLVAYVRAINLQHGDVQELVVKGPDGAVLAQAVQPALDRAKAQYMFFAGKRAPSGGWKLGAYSATYSVLRDGKVALSHTFALVL